MAFIVTFAQLLLICAVADALFIPWTQQCTRRKTLHVSLQKQTLPTRSLSIHHCASVSSSVTYVDKYLTKGYRRPLHWVQKVCHLEDTLEFFEKNFKFRVFRHEEFSSGCAATCNGPYGGAWSKTMIGPGDDEGSEFAFELVYNYGINKYDRGNDIRYIAMRKSAFVGSPDAITNDDNDRSFLRTPDGHYIMLVDDSNDLGNVNPVSYISLHVSDLSASRKFYEEVLGARVVINRESPPSSFLRWPKSNANQELNGVGVELVQLPNSQSVDHAEAQGRFAIETEDGAPFVMAKKVQNFGVGTVMHGPVKLEPHGEEVTIVQDSDGHEYCFVDARGFQRCVDVAKRQNGNQVDWQFRKNIEKKARTTYISGKDLGPHMTLIDGLQYQEFVSSTQEDIVIELYAPWCIICARNKPILQDVARRYNEVGSKIIFAMLDGSAVPFSRIEDPQLLMMLQWAKDQGFPAMFFVSGKDRESLALFDGDWTNRDVAAWVKAQAQAQASSQVDKWPEIEDSAVLSAADVQIDVGNPSLSSATTPSAESEDDDDDDDCGNCSL